MRNLFVYAVILSIMSITTNALAKENDINKQVAQIQTEEDKEISEDGIVALPERAISVEQADKTEEIEELDLSLPPSQAIYVDKTPKLKLPECNNEVLIKLVEAKVAEFYKSHPADSLLEKRRQALLLKNLRAYTEVPTEGFTSKQNYNVANHLLMTKINEGLDDSKIKLCKNAGLGNASDIYLLIYPQNFQIKISILNLLKNPQEEFFVIYPKILL